MPANLENSAVATGLENICFHSNPKENENKVAESCPALCDPMDRSLTGSSTHGIFQVRVLEWLAISFSNPNEWQCQRMLHYHTIAVISHASKLMLKILQSRLQQYMNGEIPVFKLYLEKAEEPEIKLPTSVWSWKEQESSRKTSISALLTMPKPLTVWITTNWKILKEMGISDLPLEKSVCKQGSNS